MRLPTKSPPPKNRGILQAVITHGGFQTQYRITVDPPIAEQREWEHPEILVEFAGPDSALLLERGGELLRSVRTAGHRDSSPTRQRARKNLVRLQKFSLFRIEELQMAARAAADKVRRTGEPYRFAPMSSRERRMVHLALREEKDLRTEATAKAADAVWSSIREL